MKDLKISFYLKAVPADNKPVIMKANFGYKEQSAMSGASKYIPLIYNTGLKLRSDQWDVKTNYPILLSDIGKLEELKLKVSNTYNHLSNYGEITPELLRVELDDILGRKKKAQSVVEICSYMEQRIITRTDLHPRTIDHYEVLIGKLRAYERAKGIILTNETLDREHYLGFQEQCKKELGTANSVWGVMKNVKSVLNKLRRDYKNLNVFNPVDELGGEEKIRSTTDPKVYLDFQQIQKIIEYEPVNDRDRNIRLILLTLLFTGCRYSDVFKVVPEKLHSDERVQFRYAHFITDKGSGAEVIVPILKPLEDAFSVNGNKPARKISATKFNLFVKELCAKIGFDQEVKIAYTDTGGGKKFQSQEFFRFVSSHIGRRSFVTNLINAVPVTILSKITGHSLTDNSVIFKYNKISLIQNAVLFVKELKRISEDEDRKEEFPIQLV